MQPGKNKTVPRRCNPMINVRILNSDHSKADSCRELAKYHRHRKIKYKQTATEVSKLTQVVNDQRDMRLPEIWFCRAQGASMSLYSTAHL